MKKTEHRVLGEFDSLFDAMEYMDNTENKFIFYVSGDIYSIDGVELTTEESSIFFEDYDLKILHINTLIGEIYETPSEGQIYIKDNILTFYTITNG